MSSANYALQSSFPHMRYMFLLQLILLLHITIFPISVVSVLFSPDLLARHFDERVLKDAPPATIKMATKDGVKKKMALVEKEEGKKEWKWVKEGEEETPKRSWRKRNETKKEEPPREFLFDPPTPVDQSEFQEKLLDKQDIDIRVPKDVYSEYHKTVRKYADSKKVKSKTVPAKYAEIKDDDDNLYRAFSYALAGTEKLHKAVRIYVGEYYSEFYGKWGKQQEQKWMDDFDIGSVRRYGEKLKEGAAGRHADVIAAAKKLNINVLVYDSDKDIWLCMSHKTGRKEDIEKKRDCQDKNKLTIALEFIDKEHYDVILDVKEK